MSKEQLILPKSNDEGVPYVSYSQLSTWKRSKRDYIRQYFLGERFVGNAYTEMGSKVGEALENNDFSEFTLTEQKFLKTVPRYDQFERKINLQMEGFIVVGYIDSNTLSHKTKGGNKVEVVDKILDYKTGDVSKKRAEYEDDKYTQLDIYAAAMQQETGSLPTDVKVILIDRTGNAFKGEELKLGKEFITITKDVTQERVDKVLKEVQEIAEEISAYYKLYLKLNGLI